jgi:predicted Fe-S protein YdhL (DUF1289 family)
MNITDEQPHSPCIRQCCLDDNDICIGCFRSLNEILNWAESDSISKSATIHNCQTRKNDFSKSSKR